MEDDDSKSYLLSGDLRSYDLHLPITPYICCTHEDFKDEREFLKREIFPALDEICKRRGTSFLPIDIHWTGGYHKQIENCHFLKLCFDCIDFSPYFLCMLGETYGKFRLIDEPLLSRRVSTTLEEVKWMAKNCAVVASAGHQWILDELHSYCSITELEIFHGVFSRDTKYGYFYFREPEHLEDKMETVHDADERRKLKDIYLPDNDEALLKIRSLKNEVLRQCLPVKYFRTMQELGTLVFSDWKCIIDKIYPPLDIFSKWTNEENYWEWAEHEAFAESRRKIFFQTAAISSIMQQLTDFAKSAADCSKSTEKEEDIPFHPPYEISMLFPHKNPPAFSAPKDQRIMVLKGETGCGKSAIIANWIQTFRKDFFDVCIIYHFVGCSSYSFDLSLLLYRCTREMRKAYFTKETMNWAALNFDVESFPRNFHELVQAFQASLTLGPVVLVIDGVDRLQAPPELSLQKVKEMQWLPSSVARHCRIVLTTSLSDLSCKALAQQKMARIINIPQLDENSVKESLLYYFVDTCTPWLCHVNFQKVLQMQLSGNMFFYKLFSVEIQNFSIYRNLNGFMEQYTECYSIREFLSSCLMRRIKDFSWTTNGAPPKKCREIECGGWVVDALSLLLISRNGLTQEDLLKLLEDIGYTGKAKVTMFHWLLFRNSLAEILYMGIDGRIHFSSLYIKELFSHILLNIFGFLSLTVKMFISTDAAEAKKKKQYLYHCLIANHFLKQPLSQHVLEEVPWQLLLSGRLEDLSKYLTDTEVFKKMVGQDEPSFFKRHELLSLWRLMESSGFDVLSPHIKLFNSIKLTKNSEIADHKSSSLEQAMIEKREDATKLQSFQESVRCSTSSQGTSDSEHSGTLSPKLQTVWNCAIFLEKLGKYSVATCALVALDSYLNEEGYLNEDCLLHGMVQNQLGELLFRTKGEPDDAEVWYKKAAETIDNVYLSTISNDQLYIQKLLHIRGHALIRLGQICEGSNRIKEADMFIMEALCITQGFENLMDLATAYHLQGLIKFKRMNFFEATFRLNDALEMRKKWFGECHPLVADIMLTQAQVYSCEQNENGFNMQEAERLMWNTLEIRQVCLGLDHIMIAIVQFELGKLLQKIPKRVARAKGVQLISYARDIATLRLGMQHDFTQEISRCYHGLIGLHKHKKLEKCMGTPRLPQQVYYIRTPLEKSGSAEHQPKISYKLDFVNYPTPDIAKEEDKQEMSGTVKDNSHVTKPVPLLEHTEAGPNYTEQSSRFSSHCSSPQPPPKLHIPFSHRRPYIHLNNCHVPGSHEIHSCMTRSVHGPNSTILSLLHISPSAKRRPYTGFPRIAWDKNRNVSASAWSSMKSHSLISNKQNYAVDLVLQAKEDGKNNLEIV